MGVHRGRRSTRWGFDLVNERAKSFFIDALTSAFDLGIATPDDILRHVTPDLLGQHLPRPLWARLLTACIGAPKLDAQLIVETVGVGNLCEHMPVGVMWSVLTEVAARALGGELPARPAAAPSIAASTPSAPGSRIAATTPATPLAVASPPPPETRTGITPAPPPRGPKIPGPKDDLQSLADVVDALHAEDEAIRPPTRSRTPTGQRFRQTSTNIGRLAANQRRPQAAVPAPTPEIDPATEPTRPPRAPATTVRRSETEVEVEVETEAGGTNTGDWRNALAVEDDQLVDWSSSDETQTSGEDSSQYRKR